MKCRVTALTIVILAALAIYARFVSTRWLRVTRLRVSLPGLPAEWNGLRISLLSDFHAGGGGVSTSMLQQAKSAALEFQPDLIAIAGDFYDDGRIVETGDLFTCWPHLTPVVGVLGNHDWRGSIDNLKELAQQLHNSDVVLLSNQATRLSLRGREAWIAGVADPHTRRDNVAQTFAQIPDGSDVLLVLAHSPAAIVSIEPGSARMLFAGHTHGGQVRITPSGSIPFVNTIRRLRGLRPQPPLPLARGWHWSRGLVVIISDGLGLSTLPFRFRTRPQVIMVELSEASSSSGPDCEAIGRYVEDVSAEHRLLRWLT